MNLTPLQYQLAQLKSQGMSNKEMAYLMKISLHAVELGMVRVYTKYGVKNEVEFLKKFFSLQMSENLRFLSEGKFIKEERRVEFDELVEKWTQERVFSS